MALCGGIVAPINKERLETELGIRFRAFGTGWRYDWQSDGMLARVVRPRQGSVVRLRCPWPPHPQDIRRNDHALRLGRQRAATRMDGRK